jgi:hypothetical protein
MLPPYVPLSRGHSSSLLHYLPTVQTILDCPIHRYFPLTKASKSILPLSCCLSVDLSYLQFSGIYTGVKIQKSRPFIGTRFYSRVTTQLVFLPLQIRKQKMPRYPIPITAAAGKTYSGVEAKLRHFSLQLRGVLHCMQSSGLHHPPALCATHTLTLPHHRRYISFSTILAIRLVFVNSVQGKPGGP